MFSEPKGCSWNLLSQVHFQWEVVSKMSLLTMTWAWGVPPRQGTWCWASAGLRWPGDVLILVPVLGAPSATEEPAAQSHSTVLHYALLMWRWLVFFICSNPPISQMGKLCACLECSVLLGIHGSWGYYLSMSISLYNSSLLPRPF